MNTKKSPAIMPKQTIFQQLAAITERVREGKATPDDIILMMRHPHLASLIIRNKAKK